MADEGHLYLFLNRRRRLAKALWFDGSGWCLLSKRREHGSFQLPPTTGDVARVQIDGTTFAALLSGLDFTADRTRVRRSAGPAAGAAEDQACTPASASDGAQAAPAAFKHLHA